MDHSTGFRYHTYTKALLEDFSFCLDSKEEAMSRVVIGKAMFFSGVALLFSFIVLMDPVKPVSADDPIVPLRCTAMLCTNGCTGRVAPACAGTGLGCFTHAPNCNGCTTCGSPGSSCYCY